MEEIEVFIEDTFDVTESEGEEDQSDYEEGRSSKNVDPSRQGQSEKDVGNTNTAQKRIKLREKAVSGFNRYKRYMSEEK